MRLKKNTTQQKQRDTDKRNSAGKRAGAASTSAAAAATAAAAAGTKKPLGKERGRAIGQDKRGVEAIGSDDDDDDDDDDEKTLDDEQKPLIGAAAGLAALGVAASDADVVSDVESPSKQKSKSTPTDMMYFLKRHPTRPWTRVPELTLQDVSRCFHMPVKQASEALGISVTVLKLQCRKLKISRWPYRKIQTINDLIEKTSSAISAENHVGPKSKHLLKTVEQLRAHRQELLNLEKTQLDPGISALASAVNKHESKRRRLRNAGFPPVDSVLPDREIPDVDAMENVPTSVVAQIIGHRDVSSPGRGGGDPKVETSADERQQEEEEEKEDKHGARGGRESGGDDSAIDATGDDAVGNAPMDRNDAVRPDDKGATGLGVSGSEARKKLKPNKLFTSVLPESPVGVLQRVPSLDDSPSPLGNIFGKDSHDLLGSRALAETHGQQRNGVKGD